MILTSHLFQRLAFRFGDKERGEDTNKPETISMIDG